VGKLLKIGNQAINVRTEAYYNVENRIRRRTGSGALRFSFCFPNERAKSITEIYTILFGIPAKPDASVYFR
jgi:hypothetical protein